MSLGLLMSCWPLYSIISPTPAKQRWRALEITENLPVEFTSSSTLQLEGWENGTSQSKLMLTRVQETQDCSAKGFCQCLPQIRIQVERWARSTGNASRQPCCGPFSTLMGHGEQLASQLNTNFEDLQNECACVQVSLHFRNFPLVVKTSLWWAFVAYLPENVGYLELQT